MCPTTPCRQDRERGRQRHRERQRETHTDRQTDRQTQTHRETDRQTETETENVHKPCLTWYLSQRRNGLKDFTEMKRTQHDSFLLHPFLGTAPSVQKQTYI